ncbi:MAG: PhnD/SsuA/transferrin family substrate-binding protein [Calothrix sp. C42_A2020_038]|nr:PhnD/SsuA/transferrin family substrate-binding protein [Calothrix sp. C42_A2020_038]
MKFIRFSRLLLQVLIIGIFSAGCTAKNNNDDSNIDKLSIGVVSYGEGATSLSKYERFKDYIATKTKAIVELEPAYNELQAVAQVQRQTWQIVFAPPGLAAIAIASSQYKPIFSMEGVSNRQRSLFLVRDDKSYQKIGDLANKVIALGETGSAAAFYVPLYDLYGMTLAQIKSASTPKVALTWLTDGTVEAIAISESDFETYKREFPQVKFRVLHTSRWIPAGVVLAAANLNRNRLSLIQKAMREAPADVVADAGYVPASKIPNYEQFIKLVEKVRPFEEKVEQTPVVLVPSVIPVTTKQIK